MDRTEVWDKEAIYDSDISPLMRQIIAICKRNGIPMVACFQYGSDEQGPMLCTTALTDAAVTADVLRAAVRLIYDANRAPLVVTVRGADGKVKLSEVIL